MSTNNKQLPRAGSQARLSYRHDTIIVGTGSGAKSFKCNQRDAKDRRRATAEAEAYWQQRAEALQASLGRPLTVMEQTTLEATPEPAPNVPRSLKPPASQNDINPWDGIVAQLEESGPGPLTGDEGRWQRRIAVARKAQAEHQVRIESDRVEQARLTEPELVRAKGFIDAQIQAAQLDGKTSPQTLANLSTLKKYADSESSTPGGIWSLARDLGILKQDTRQPVGVETDMARELKASNVYEAGMIQGGPRDGR